MPDDSRTRMVRAAARLFQERGYDGTSFQDVIARSGAPRGSIYHHFPGGKEELAAEALRWYASRVRAKLEDGPALKAIAGYLDATREFMLRTDFRAGCPIAGVALDVSDGDSPLHTMVAEAFAEWQGILIRSFEKEGVPAELARSLARFVLAALEGALLLARAERSVQPLDDVSEQLLAYVEGRVAAASR